MATTQEQQEQLSEPGYWEVIPLKKFREKDQVTFTMVPVHTKYQYGIHGIDHVVHRASALSPGYVGGVLGWYLHPHQQDNLLVFSGMRTSTLRHRDRPITEPAEVFTVTRDEVRRNGRTIYRGAAVLRWEANVYHRVESGPDGSVSLNFAVRSPGFSIDHEFDIWELDEKTGAAHVIRAGKDDQFGV
jgi:hypothetical protein